LTSRILVTGGAGFVGSSVVHALLERGDEVVVLDTGVAAGFGHVTDSAARVIEGDISDRSKVDAALAGCDAIIHLAAQTSVPQSIADPLHDLEINVNGSVGLLEAARAAGVARFVFASSNATVSGHTPPVHEGLVPFPVSPYGAAKAAVEAYLRAYGKAYGLETIGLRFANAYGPRSAHKSSVVASFVKAYLGGGPLEIRGSGEQTRDFIHVSDVAAMLLTCLDAPPGLVAGEILQVGTGVETSLLTLAQTLFEVGGHEVAIEHREPSAGDVARSVGDVEKARRVLGWTASVALQDGVDETLKWFREHWRA
jgi:UDP-glucose 4-epimerase